jgi:NAD(P)-dependent dehydrogenase (short-subunit alcohol dehydrogenase family)
MTTTRVQIVLVTGAGSGFGRATAIELTRAGHIVYASMRRDDLEGHSKERWASLRSVASEERLDLRPLELDFQEDASRRAAVDRIVADEGRLDVAMNNAAMTSSTRSGRSILRWRASTGSWKVSRINSRIGLMAGRRHDIGKVAEAIRDIIAMAPGTRPKRIDIDPRGRDVGKINDLTAQLQRDFFGRMAMADLLEPTVSG